MTGLDSTIEVPQKMTLIKESDIESKETIGLATPAHTTSKAIKGSQRGSVTDANRLSGRNKFNDYAQEVSTAKPMRARLAAPETHHLPKTENASPVAGGLRSVQQKMEVKIRKTSQNLN